MGGCSSCESTSVETAKLILLDGQLQEFSYPVKVSQVLQKHPSCFICNSDEMNFDDFVSAVSGDEELQLGQLYFALPLRNLRQPLQAEEMAALAVKASSALMKSGNDGDKIIINGCCKNTASLLASPVGFAGEERRSQRKLGAGGGLVERSSGGRRRNFKIKLSAIPE